MCSNHFSLNNVPNDSSNLFHMFVRIKRWLVNNLSTIWSPHIKIIGTFVLTYRNYVMFKISVSISTNINDKGV